MCVYMKNGHFVVTVTAALLASNWRNFLYASLIVCYCMFFVIYLFIYSVQSFIYSFNHSFINVLIYSFFIHSFIFCPPSKMTALCLAVDVIFPML